MKILLNGDIREIVRATNIGELIAELALPVAITLVEHNGLALRRDEWPQRPLADGDRVEVVRIVAGG
ncbi:MAG: sulfur carrier protein ThiS [Chthoniobacter sp.]|nr:sulfur carrier protein ThiS [Chthoniobacter sp.]